jgi:hypothetical protein
VGVFGGSFASEISLPPAIAGGAKYKVDFTMVLVDEHGRLREFVAIEVQSIDTTNSYGVGLSALERTREVVTTGVGLNWENVNKRILPQLIIKGLVLQGEERCTKGMFFVTPETVYQKIMTRLGGNNRLRRIPMQPSSITFVRLAHDFPGSAVGEPMKMRFLEEQTVSISDMSLAFISPENLPVAGAYGRSIQAKL